ncbi:autophagy-related protein 13-domain-containing protein [Clohesyomyces aquaticus]|uniref:Autophagy-related protein 13 n=1 Tax=Clohesyomyces aquaticus TaxID=1231657 RepID=A0A1Y1ZS11_9PLEO|nr:autophagy-related protein 13-domain-containing protein [Clohesyomyces aquaticus]
MHPHPRHSPRTASAANNLQTNPTRTNNQRESNMERSERSSPYSDTAIYSDRSMDEGEGEMVGRADQRSETEQQKNHQKVNQVIQNFFTKAALTIISSRVVLPLSFNNKGELRQNKWFNVVLDDTDVLLQDLMEWKTMDAVQGQHPSLCIEIYLDIKGLGPKQSLVVHDDQGKRWDVAEALNVPVESTSRPPSRMGKSTQLVLERWRIHVGDKNLVHPSELKDPLPNVYKKAVVLFRSLYAYLRFLPAFKYYKSIAKQPANNPSLKLNYRISNGDFKSPRPDTLSIPLYPSSEAVTEIQNFTPSNSPIGPLCISTEYRTNCEFSVDDSESLLSSHFMGLDDTYLEQTNRDVGQVPGSLPVNKLNPQDTPDLGQAYGSMSTFHQVGVAPGTSPMSALRAARDMPSSSPVETPPQKLPPNHRIAQGSKSSLRSADNPSYQRRTSVSFQPAFKAGSLSSSPAPGPAVLPSPGSSVGRPGSSLGRPSGPNPLTQPRNRTSLTALPQAALRAPSLPNETAIASSASSSPKPAPITRYSSSFGHRRSRFSSGGGSKTEDDNLSSGKGSVSSSQQPGSDVLNEGEGASSGSIKSDDQNISDFLKLLEQKKDLKSFNRSDNASKDATMRRTTAQLSKYQRMKESHTALSDSVSSSMLLHRSSSSSSRQLSSVPQMIAGTSVSTSSSPGKPISPHTPHTPAIPSRLSANSIIEYEPRRSRSRPSQASRREEAPDVREQSESDDQGTNAIDIPTSPRPWNFPRRSSSVAQQNRALEDEPDIFGLRSASLPTEEVDRERDLQRITNADLTSSGLFAQTELLASTGRGDEGNDSLRPDSRSEMPRPLSTSDLPAKRGHHTTGSRGRGGLSSHQGSSTNLSSGGTSSTERPSRYNFSSRPTLQDDDEPLLFQMSDMIGGGSRRSLEEGRGGSSTGSGGRRGSPWLR